MRPTLYTPTDPRERRPTPEYQGTSYNGGGSTLGKIAKWGGIGTLGLAGALGLTMASRAAWNKWKGAPQEGEDYGSLGHRLGNEITTSPMWGWVDRGLGYVDTLNSNLQEATQPLISKLGEAYNKVSTGLHNFGTNVGGIASSIRGAFQPQPAAAGVVTRPPSNAYGGTVPRYPYGGSNYSYGLAGSLLGRRLQRGEAALGASILGNPNAQRYMQDSTGQNWQSNLQNYMTRNIAPAFFPFEADPSAAGRKMMSGFASRYNTLRPHINAAGRQMHQWGQNHPGLAGEYVGNWGSNLLNQSPFTPPAGGGGGAQVPPGPAQPQLPASTGQVMTQVGAPSLPPPPPPGVQAPPAAQAPAYVPGNQTLHGLGLTQFLPGRRNSNPAVSTQDMENFIAQHGGRGAAQVARVNPAAGAPAAPGQLPLPGGRRNAAAVRIGNQVIHPFQGEGTGANGLRGISASPNEANWNWDFLAGGRPVYGQATLARDAGREARAIAQMRNLDAQFGLNQHYVESPVNPNFGRSTGIRYLPQYGQATLARDQALAAQPNFIPPDFGATFFRPGGGTLGPGGAPPGGGSVGNHAYGGTVPRYPDGGYLDALKNTPLLGSFVQGFRSTFSPDQSAPDAVQDQYNANTPRLQGTGNAAAYPGALQPAQQGAAGSVPTAAQAPGPAPAGAVPARQSVAPPPGPVPPPAPPSGGVTGALSSANQFLGNVNGVVGGVKNLWGNLGGLYNTFFGDTSAQPAADAGYGSRVGTTLGNIAGGVGRVGLGLGLGPVGWLGAAALGPVNRQLGRLGGMIGSRWDTPAPAPAQTQTAQTQTAAYGGRIPRYAGGGSGFLGNFVHGAIPGIGAGFLLGGLGGLGLEKFYTDRNRELAYQTALNAYDQASGEPVPVREPSNYLWRTLGGGWKGALAGGLIGGLSGNTNRKRR